MERLPVDVWCLIFSYACTDGGRTGAALSTASRTLRAMSAPSRFHSLKLTRLDQISQLLLCFERIKRRASPALARPTLDTPVVRHLFLSFLPEDGHAPAPRERSEYSRNKHKQRAQVEEDARAAREAQGAWDRQFAYVVPQLLALVRPTLETLVVLQRAAPALPHVGVGPGPGGFPALRELTLLADDRMFVRLPEVWSEGGEEADAGDCEGGEAPFPKLTRLHIVYEGSKTHPWERTLPVWGELAPAVTHLRISQASRMIPAVVEEITTGSFGRARVTPADGRERLAFPRLERVIIQPLVMEPVRGHEQRDELERLRRVPKAKEGPTVVVMCGRWYRAGYWRDRLRWEWEGRMLGERGCWGEREDDEGEWAYERRKRAEVAARKTRMLAAVAGRVVSMIRLDNEDHPSLRVSRVRWPGTKHSLSI